MTDFLSSVSSASVLAPPSSASSSFLQYVSAGDVISHDPSGNLLGHGTLLVDGKMMATVSGFVDRVNQLVTVRALNSRYTGEIGDVVVGRVMEVGDQRWKVDIGSRQYATLLLASIHLPGGALRRRNAEDSLSIRSYFAPGDVIACEVQKVRSDASLNLHTRNERYGRRSSGALIQAQPALIKRCKQHFQRVEGVDGVELCLGCNGWIWVCVTRGQVQVHREDEAEQEDADRAADVELSREERERVVRVLNAIHVLNAQGMAIWNASISDVYAASVDMGLPAKAMRNPDVIPVLGQTAMAKRAAHPSKPINDEG